MKKKKRRSKAITITSTVSKLTKKEIASLKRISTIVDNLKIMGHL
jgi:hypothetical protein